MAQDLSADIERVSRIAAVPTILEVARMVRSEDSPTGVLACFRELAVIGDAAMRKVHVILVLWRTITGSLVLAHANYVTIKLPNSGDCCTIRCNR